ncbi:uncharacterized protein METZ01_LOCUS120525, partial [marine metagenome]
LLWIFVVEPAPEFGRGRERIGKMKIM